MVLRFGSSILAVALCLMISQDINAASDKKPKATPANELSCSKQARRIAKITDRTKRRAYIKECREKREQREKAAELAEQKKKEREKN